MERELALLDNPVRKKPMRMQRQKGHSTPLNFRVLRCDQVKYKLGNTHRIHPTPYKGAGSELLQLSVADRKKSLAFARAFARGLIYFSLPTNSLSKGLLKNSVRLWKGWLTFRDPEKIPDWQARLLAGLSLRYPGSVITTDGSSYARACQYPTFELMSRVTCLSALAK